MQSLLSLDFLLAQSPTPVFDGAYFVALLSRVFHTTCGATLLGGLIYLRFVLAPAVNNAEDNSAEERCFAGRRQAWARCVGICTLLLLASGFYNFLAIVRANEKLPSLYHMLFGIKFLLAFVVFALAAFTAGKTNLAQKMRKNLKRWLNLALAATLAIFVIGAVLRSIPKVPKTADAAAEQAGLEAASEEAYASTTSTPPSLEATAIAQPAITFGDRHHG